METVVRLMGEIDPSLAKSMKAAQAQFKKINKTAVAVNGAFIAMGAVAIKALSDGTKKAVEFQKQMSNVATLLDGDVNKRIGELNKEVLKVSNSTGIMTSDLTDGLYQVISAIGDTKDATKVLEIAAKAAKAGNATTTDSVNLLTAVTKGYGDTSAEAMQKIADLAFQTVKLGQTDFPQLASSMGAVIPMAKALGVTQEELFGGYATLTGVTGNAAEVTTQLNGTLKGFLKPSKDMAYVMKKLGYQTGDQMLKANGLEKSLLMLKQAVGNDENAFANLFGSIEGKKAVLALTGAQVDSMTAKTKAMYEAAGLATEAFRRQKDNVDSLQEDVRNLLDNGLTQLGMLVLPIIKAGLQTLLPVLEFVSKYSEALIPIIGGVVAGLGSFSIIQSVVTLMNLWKATTIATTLANGGLVAALRAVWLAMASNPIGWICVAIGGLITMIALLVANWDKVKNVMIKVWEVCKDVFGKMGKFIKEYLIDTLIEAMGKIGQIIQGIFKIKGGLSSMQEVKNSDIPKLAAGGFTNGISIAGEAGREAVISFLPQYRSDNIATWLKAGELLGVSSGSSSSSYNLGGFTFSPVINGSGLNKEELISALRESEGEMLDFIENLLERKSATSYANYSPNY